MFAVRAPVGEINITMSKCAIGRGIATIFCNKSDLMYSYYLLVQNKKHFQHLSQGTIFEAINREHIIQVRLPYSPDKREQSKIASILSGVDAICSLLLYTKTQAMQTIFLRLWGVTTS